MSKQMENLLGSELYSKLTTPEFPEILKEAFSQKPESELFESYIKIHDYFTEVINTSLEPALIEKYTLLLDYLVKAEQDGVDKVRSTIPYILTLLILISSRYVIFKGLLSEGRPVSESDFLCLANELCSSSIATSEILASTLAESADFGTNIVAGISFRALILKAPNSILALKRVIEALVKYNKITILAAILFNLPSSKLSMFLHDQEYAKVVNSVVIELMSENKSGILLQIFENLADYQEDEFFFFLERIIDELLNSQSYDLINNFLKEINSAQTQISEYISNRLYIYALSFDSQNKRAALDALNYYIFAIKDTESLELKAERIFSQLSILSAIELDQEALQSARDFDAKAGLDISDGLLVSLVSVMATNIDEFDFIEMGVQDVETFLQ